MVLFSVLETARDILARRLAGDNHAIPDPVLNYLAASSLLQVLFLKTGEECGFIEPGTVLALAACDGIAGRMGRACSDAGLDTEIFEKGPGSQRNLPVMPDAPLRFVLARAEEPDFPVPVAGLPLDEFAVVLEHFLGMRLQAADGGRVKRTGKSALLYTGSVDVPPQELVSSVVKEAIGPAGAGAVTGSGQAYRVLDPACGAGLFLLALYRFLVSTEKSSAGSSGHADDRSRDILCSSVFGTDIDPETVSAARLVLLLAYIGERRQEGAGSPQPGQIRGICRSLVRNIRCGNALIAPDYFSGKPEFPFNAEERRRVNPLDWHEAFPEEMRAGGFDAVIGAPPPYRPLAVKAREEYFQTQYDAYAPSAGLYAYFIERGLTLLRTGGTLGLLVPGTFLRSREARPLRRLLLSRRILMIGSTGRTRSLPAGDVPLYILLLRNEPPAGPFVVSAAGRGPAPAPGSPDGTRRFTLDQRQLGDGGWRLEDTRETDLLARINAAATPLDLYCLGQIGAGREHMRNNPLIVDAEKRDQLVQKARRCGRFFIPLLRPADLRRWVPAEPSRFLVIVKDRQDLRECPDLKQFLDLAAEPAIPKAEAAAESPPSAGMFRPGQEEREPVPKIIFAQYQHCPTFCYDPDGSYAISDRLLAIYRKDPFLLALLNSALGRFVIRHTCPLTERGYHLNPPGIGKFPVRTPDFDKRADRTRHDKLVALVTQILELNRYLTQAKTDQERRLVQQEIDATDVRIDALVYELYGLTRDEIALVEETAGK